MQQGGFVTPQPAAQIGRRLPTILGHVFRVVSIDEIVPAAAIPASDGEITNGISTSRTRIVPVRPISSTLKETRKPVAKERACHMRYSTAALSVSHSNQEWAG